MRSIHIQLALPHLFATTLPNAGALASNNLEPKDLFLSETFANLRCVQFGSDRCFQCPFWDNVLEDSFGLTLLRSVFLEGQSCSPQRTERRTRRAEALPRAYEAGAMLVIASIILLALIVAAVGGGGLILARR